MSDFYTNRRVLVTGGSGFVGRHLVAALRQRGAIVLNLDRNSNQDHEYCDLRERFGVPMLFRRRKPQVVFHLAAQTEVLWSMKEPMTTYEINVHGTLKILDACREHAVQSVVVASTDKVYGHTTGPVREDDMGLQPVDDPYSSSKRLADQLCHDYAHIYGLPVKVVRCANIYGPGQRNGTTLITAAVNRLQQGLTPVVYQGQELAVREWLYVEDAVRAYLELGARSEPQPLAWNVGSGEQLTVADVVVRIMRWWKHDGDYEIRPAPAGRPSSLRLDSSRFRTYFPGRSPVSFDDGLNRTLTWYRNNPEGSA